MKILIQIRSLIALIMFGVLTILLAMAGIVLNLTFNQRRLDSLIVYLWGMLSCRLFGIKVVTRGFENFNKVGGAVVLFNHASFVDILALSEPLRDLRFGAKIELFKIPFFGMCMRRFGTLPIARNNREEVFRVYQEAKVHFERGQKFALSPEGGRFFGEDLSPFKAGPFIFALNAKVPLIPIVIKGAYEAWPKGQLLANSDKWCRTVEIDILDPIPTDSYSLDTRQQLQEHVYKTMNTVYKR